MTLVPWLMIYIVRKIKFYTFTAKLTKTENACGSVFRAKRKMKSLMVLLCVGSYVEGFNLFEISKNVKAFSLLQQNKNDVIGLHGCFI